LGAQSWHFQLALAQVKYAVPVPCL
jgi:hypothetical protein